jgi:two-component system, NtrC family, nitrogen regulation response regulator GlnG
MSRGRVLLLEDDVALRGLLQEALQAEDFDVDVFDSYAQLRQAAAEQRGDVVVADFWGGGQRSLLDTDRTEIAELASLLPLILLTGRSWAADMTAGELGTRAIIRKPFDLDELMRTLEGALG